jgi:4-carboxymuconolactone decarboxylase
MRLTPLPEDEWDERARDSLAAMVAAERRNPRDAGNALATLVRHPDLTQAYLPFNAYVLLRSSLPPRLRAHAILRVAHHHSGEYEWAHHVPLAKQEGLSDNDIAAIRDGQPVDGFDRAVLNAVDELHLKSRISDQTWAQLGERLDERQRMDLVFTVGCYGALAMALNTFGVEVEQLNIAGAVAKKAVAQ